MVPPSLPLTALDPQRVRLPEKPALEGLEAKWISRWDEAGVYRFRQSPERANVLRSEEHTSELQSPDHLVCRLLLEKKKLLPLIRQFMKKRSDRHAQSSLHVA